MCGIAGQLLFDESETVSATLLRQMCRTLVHRGPDDEGIHVAGQVGLAHRRLSVIDLTTGHQPLANEDGTVWTVVNGEIYNYIELRKDLEQRGHTFRSTADSEVIVHLYEEKGADFVEALRGMFAIAVWDERRRVLVLARDRVGKKPLFYSVIPERGLVFGSEIKALLVDPAVERRLNVEALDAYLSLLYVPAPLTIFENIFKLEAGHLLIARGEKVTRRRYWDLQFEERPTVDPEVAREELRRVLGSAVDIRLRSDVPLGAFLSGGVDSSAVVASMMARVDRPVHTYTVGFDDDAHNELRYARRVAEWLGCVHHDEVIAPDVSDLVPRIARHFDEPFADSSAIPTYLVSQMARRQVTVALSGEGGDEMFAGYWYHTADRMERRLRRALGLVGSRALLAVSEFIPGLKGRQGLERLAMPPDLAYAAKHAGMFFDGRQKAKLYTDGLRRECRSFDPAAAFRSFYNRCSASDPLDKALYVDLKTYLVDDLLVKVDRMSMAHGLEIRAPLLDQELVEFCGRLPASLKLRGRTSKYLLKAAMADVVPPEVLTREKHGFTMPIGVWLRGGLREMAESCLMGTTATQRGLFDARYVEEMWSRHVSGTQDYSHCLWGLVMFELWQREYLDSIPWSKAV